MKPTLPTLIVIPCTKLKLFDRVSGLQTAPAVNVYMVSDYFRKCYAYARRYGTATRILSAKYGLLEPEQQIGPYNVSLNDARGGRMCISAAAAVADQIVAQKLYEFPVIQVIGGARYRALFEKAYRIAGTKAKFMPFDIEAPFAGLPIGKLKRALKEAVL